MRKKGAALRAVQEEEGRDDPSTGSGRTGTGVAVVASKPPLPTFTPVPRRYRHDGWTPERQKLFIEALADTGCVTRAAGMVNMAQTNCYTLRRAPGAEEFRRAWDAALDFGLKRLKDIAFERAIEGQLVPVFVAGKLLGFRRKRNDALLMFCLRHYGQDASGKRTTINYFSSRASAGSLDCARDERGGVSTSLDTNGREGGRPSTLRPGSGHASLGTSDGRAGARAEASTTTVRTVISGPGAATSLDMSGKLEAAASVLNGFEGVELDAEAEAAIGAALEACAARARALQAAYDKGGAAAADAGECDPDSVFFRSDLAYRGELVPGYESEDFLPAVEGETPWELAGAEKLPALVEWEEEQERKGAAECAEPSRK